MWLTAKLVVISFDKNKSLNKWILSDNVRTYKYTAHDGSVPGYDFSSSVYKSRNDAIKAHSYVEGFMLLRHKATEKKSPPQKMDGDIP